MQFNVGDFSEQRGEEKMRLIIDIPDEEYNRIKEWEDNITGYQTSLALYRAVRNGIPYKEIPRGNWITDGAGNITCSNCGFSLGSKIVKLLRPLDFPYCTDCGADMRGNKKETTFDDYLKEKLKDPEFRKEWEKLCDEEIAEKRVQTYEKPNT